MKNLLFNAYFHGAVLAVCFMIMGINVILTGANNLDELTVVGKIAAILFIADLFFFVGYGFLKMIFKWK